jgi:hypothetical protein
MKQLTLRPRKNTKFFHFFSSSFRSLVVIHSPQFALQIGAHNDAQFFILEVLEREVGSRDPVLQRPAGNEHGMLIRGRKPTTGRNFLRIRILALISYSICQPI